MWQGTGEELPSKLSLWLPGACNPSCWTTQVGVPDSFHLPRDLEPELPLYRPSDQLGTWWKVKVKLHVAAAVQTRVSGSLECVPGHSHGSPFLL